MVVVVRPTPPNGRRSISAAASPAGVLFLSLASPRPEGVEESVSSNRCREETGMHEVGSVLGAFVVEAGVAVLAHLIAMVPVMAARGAVRRLGRWWRGRRR
jgi:hypothetical protein